MTAELVQVRRAEGAAGDLAVGGEATVQNARELKRALSALQVQGEAEPLRVDLSGLEALDVAGAQVLVAWRRHLGPDRVRFRRCRPEIAQFVWGSGLHAGICAWEVCLGSACT